MQPLADSQPRMMEGLCRAQPKAENTCGMCGHSVKNKPGTLGCNLGLQFEISLLKESILQSTMKTFIEFSFL